MTILLESIVGKMKISHLAKESGISQRMLRYYEQEKLLNPARTLAGYREYNQADIERIKLISQLNNAGLTLKTIKQILPCWNLKNMKFEQCEIYKQNMSETLKKIEQQIHALEQARNRLINLLSSDN